MLINVFFLKTGGHPTRRNSGTLNWAVHTAMSSVKKPIFISAMSSACVQISVPIRRAGNTNVCSRRSAIGRHYTVSVIAAFKVAGTTFSQKNCGGVRRLLVICSLSSF